MENDKKIKVIELFAGIGGFRLGLEKNNNYEVIWSNQWEPTTKRQHANETYESVFGKQNHCGKDINTVSMKDIPKHDLLVGGFPCQDYSVAKTLSHSKGLEGKKGVLWWNIHKILKEKKPSYILLENVDRLLKSPSTQRGRDFAIMLATLNELGYAVEWRVINAADYGMPQRRRRVFIGGYRKNTNLYKKIKKTKLEDWVTKEGVLASAFPVEKKPSLTETFKLDNDIFKISKDFNKGGKKSLFEISGAMINGEVVTIKTKPKYKGKYITLRDILVPEKDVPKEFFIDKDSLKKWKELKGAKKEERTTKDGFKYFYSEGGMIFPDNLDNASRTIVTGEGGSTPSRFKHVIKSPESGQLRRLIPIELERLNMFPDNHTIGQSDTKRAFFMGNALVVGIIEKIGKSLYKKINEK